MNSLRRGFANLQTLIDSRASRSEQNNNLETPAADRGAPTGANSSQQLLHVECQVAVAVTTKVKIHVSTVDPYDVRKLCSTQIVKRSEDGGFRASVCCSIDSKLQRHSRMEVRLYREDDLRSHSSTFYRSTIESILTSCLSVWCGGCSASDWKNVRRVVRTAERIIGAPLPSIQDISSQRCVPRGRNIISDPSHPHHGLFSLLPSGKRFRSIRCRSTWF